MYFRIHKNIIHIFTIELQIEKFIAIPATTHLFKTARDKLFEDIL